MSRLRSIHLGVALLTLAGLAHGAAHVRVHAASTIEVHVARSRGAVVLRGVLADEAGRPMAGQAVRADVSLGDLRVPAALEACTDEGPRDAWGARGVASLKTDASGRFCLAAKASAETVLARFSWAGSRLVDPASVEVTSDPRRSPIDLRLACAPIVDLASDAFDLDVDARTPGDGADLPADSVALVLTNEAGTELARATTGPTGEARFRVAPASRLGPPGRGELRVDAAGDPTASGQTAAPHAPTRGAVEIERRVAVRMTLAPATGDLLPPGDPDDGVTVALIVTTATGTPVSQGIVEARVDGRSVGAVAVESGHADAVATFPGDAPFKTIELRYVSDAPWLLPGQDVTVRLPVETAGPWRRAALLFAGVAVLAWLAIGRARRPVDVPALARRPPPTGQPRIDVVRAAADPRVGWTGRVIDAHEDAPVTDAEVRVERPSFAGTETLARTLANEAGRFELRCDGARRGDRLVVSARLHTTLHRELPPFGQVEIVLVLRRRAILDRLVAWARRRGAPFDKGPEPTPGLVARELRSDARAGAWAHAVERAGFGPGAVDALAEDEVERLAPPGARSKT